MTNFEIIMILTNSISALYTTLDFCKLYWDDRNLFIREKRRYENHCGELPTQDHKREGFEKNWKQGLVD